MEIKERNDRPLLQDSLRYHDVTGASTENQEENTVEKMSIKEGNFVFLSFHFLNCI